jgi:hypothetical protein
MKRLILVFCTDGNAGKALAETLRNDDTTAQLRDAATFDGVIEHCDNVIIMPDVARWPRERIEATYAGFVMETRPEPPLAQESPLSLTPERRKPGRPRNVPTVGRSD